MQRQIDAIAQWFPPVHHPGSAWGLGGWWLNAVKLPGIAGWGIGALCRQALKFLTLKKREIDAR